MAQLSVEQHSTLTSMRDRGLHNEAQELQSLYNVLQMMAPKDVTKDVIDRIDDMVRQYHAAPVPDDESVPGAGTAVVAVDPGNGAHNGPRVARTSATSKVRTKPMLTLVPWGFVVAMARVFEAGLTGSRMVDDWMDLDEEVLNRKRSSLLNHYGNEEWAAVACNAAILWYHAQKKK